MGKTATAYIKGVLHQPRKTAIVAALVRDRNVKDATEILNNTPRRPAKAVLKAVLSAEANLLAQGGVKSDSIYISTISVTAGKRLRRYMPASRGRALPYEKIRSNILVKVTGEEKVKVPEPKPEAKSQVKKEEKK